MPFREINFSPYPYEYKAFFFFFLVEESTLQLVWVRLVEVISSPFEQQIVYWIFLTTALTQQISYTHKSVCYKGSPITTSYTPVYV